MTRRLSIVIKGWIVVAAIAFWGGALGLLASFVMPPASTDERRIALASSIGELIGSVIIALGIWAMFRQREWGRYLLLGVSWLYLAALAGFAVWWMMQSPSDLLIAIGGLNFILLGTALTWSLFVLHTSKLG